MFSLEPCWSQDWCLPYGVSSSLEGRAGNLHSPYEVLQEILETSKSLNACLQIIQDCKTLHVTRHGTACIVFCYLNLESHWEIWTFRNVKVTQRFAAGVQQMLCLEEGFALVLCSAAVIADLTNSILSF